jgi:ABC-type Mn2+/Zn2+ transport system ATPase subunit
VIGRNGSGKSTLMNVLLRLSAYHPGPSSSITVNGSDGVELADLPRVQWRSRVAYVAQRPFIFSGSVEHNIRVGRQDASFAEVLRAAELAGLFLHRDGDLDESMVVGDEKEDENEEEEDLTRKDGLFSQDQAVGASDVDTKAEEEVLLSPLKPHERNALLYGTLGMRMRKYQRRAVDGVLWGASALKQRLVRLWQQRDDGGDGDVDRERHTHTLWESHDGHINPHVSPELATLLYTPQGRSYTSDRGHRYSAHRHSILAMECGVRGSALSGGILQSIALARAFLRADVDLIVVDEAMGAMDAVKKHRVVLPNLVAFAREHKAALVMVTHDVGSVCPMVDEVVLLEKGHLVACGHHESLVAANVRAYKDLLLSPERNE